MERIITFDAVTERDMDMLFALAFVQEDDFISCFISKTDLVGCKLEIINVELSKMDADGESDITAIYKINNKKYGFLIEDKINAVAMPEQCSRYFKRGETGVANGDYDDFRVFIVAPAHYFEVNEESRKYPHQVTYEECRSYFSSRKDLSNKLRVQQIDQAITKAHKQSSVIFDEKKNEYLRKYVDYQRKHFPELKSTVNIESSSKGWPVFSMGMRNLSIVHKYEKGIIDLEFSGSIADKEYVDLLKMKFEKIGIKNLSVEITGNSVCIRLYVPEISFDDDFDDITEQKLDDCFSAATILNNIAEIIAVSKKLQL